MTQLSSWLESMGLGQYTEPLVAHGVDLRSLPLLSDSELEGLGVLLGHRKLMRKALGALADATESSAQRRQLTILFCDLVGSTDLAGRLDPERLRNLMRDYQRTCADVVARYQGQVSQYRGDGLEIYFGWPRAHEDDAERSVRAALDIVSAMSKLGPEPLQVRIGISTGLVVVGNDQHLGDVSLPSAAVGQTPNVAARLQAIARPNEVVIAANTHRLLGRIFEVEELGDQVLRGFDEPIRALRVRRLAKVDGRFSASRGDDRTLFFGRQAELSVLESRWRQACDGEGQAVLLVGEPGIGKSRMAQELMSRLVGHEQIKLHCQCSPYQTGSAYFPIVERLERQADFGPDDDVECRLDKLEAMLDLDADELALVMPLFASLLSLPVDRYPARMLSPQKHKELTIEALAQLPIRHAKRRPVLIIFEDLHWGDPSTLETLTLAVEHLRRARVLLVATSRPEGAPAWSDARHVATLHLSRLARRECEAMTLGLAGGKHFPEALQESLLDQADGIPLFLEELVKSILELGILADAGDHWTFTGPLPPRAIPPTLHDLLTARLDRLGSFKELAQVCSCIGRHFNEDMLAFVARLNSAELERALQGLAASGLVLRHHVAGQPACSFKHALVQEAAYESLLMSRRQEIHALITHALIKHFGRRIRAQPELLALHLTRAGMLDRAVPQWRIAARTAIGRNMHLEALAYVETGLMLVAQLQPAERADDEVALLAAGAACHWVLHGYASQPAMNLLARAETLLDRVTDERLLVLALGGILIGSYVRADTAKALSAGERLDSLALNTTDMDQKLIAYALASTIFAHQGLFERSRRQMLFVVEHYQSDRRMAYGRTNDPKVNALVWLSWVDSTIGDVHRACDFARQAVRQAEEIAEPFALSQALSVGALALAEAGACDEALAWCARCSELCHVQRMPFWGDWALVHEGVALSTLGRHDDARDRFERALAGIAERGGRNNLGYVHARLALALARSARHEDARRIQVEGSRECVATGQPLMLAELALARGLIERLDPHAEPVLAEQWLEQALDLARRSGLLLVSLRAALALAELWSLRGEVSAARDVLDAACHPFAGMLEFPELGAARQLSMTLASSTHGER